jgi:outer membrane protein TolC
VGFNQTAPAFFDAYQSPLGTQRVGISVSMPLLQGGAGRDNMEAGRASLAQAETMAREQRAQLAEQARFAALGFMQSQSGVAIAATADSVAALRFGVTKAQYERGISSLTDLLLAQNDKDAALSSSAQALRAYWVAYYQVRRITLYDFATNRPLRE